MFLRSKCHIPRSNLNLKRVPKGFKAVETQELGEGACMSNFSIANMGESALKSHNSFLQIKCSFVVEGHKYYKGIQ